MLFPKRHRVATVIILFLSLLLSSLLIVQVDTVFASESIYAVPVNPSLPSTVPSYQSSLTYPNYAGLTESSTVPSYQSSLTYPEYAGLTVPSTVPSYQSSLTYPEYAGLTELNTP